MRKAGDVVYADCFTRGSQESYGIVKFATSEGAIRAVKELNESELLGSKILVREDRGTN